MEFNIFRMLYFFLFFGVSSVMGMLIPFLQYKGYDPIQTSMLISLCTVSGIVGQLAVGYFCDKLRTIKKIFIPSIIVLMIATTISIVINTKIIFYISFLLMGFFYYIMTNICDSWVMESGESIKSKFGPLRAFGSVGWAFGVLVSGFIISKFGYYAVNVIYVASLILALIFSTRLKDTTKECKDKISFKELLINKEYILTVIVLLVICICFRGYCQLVPYIIESVGGNTSNLGIFNFISSISEVIMLVITLKLMHKFSPDKLLIICPIAILTQVSVLYFAKSMVLIYMSAVLQFFTYPIILMVGRIMIDRVAPQNLKTSAQLVGFAIFNSIGTIIGSMSIGFLIENLSVHKSAMILIGFTIVGISSALLYDRKIKDRTI